MPVIAKYKTPLVLLQAGALCFDQIGKMLSTPDKDFSAQKVSAAINKSLLQLQTRLSTTEMVMFRDIVRELASHVDLLILSRESSALPAWADPADPAELERAQREDAVGKRVLGAAGRRGPMVMSTVESIRQGNEVIARAERNEAVTTAERIANHELISSGELQSALDVKRQALSGAVKAKRLFAIVGPSGENYYPAYYADPTLDRRALERVSKALGSLPAPSKHHFFTSKSTMLQETPLDALRKGREADVLAAAAGFAER